jgi:hypothetical protein
MKKKLINVSCLAVVAIALSFFLFSCEKDALMSAETSSAESADLNDSGTSICGNIEEYDLITYVSNFFDNFELGSVFVSNDQDNLYVQYVTTGDWYLDELHVHVVDDEPDTFLQPGHAPFSRGYLFPLTSYTIVIPLELLDFDVVCGETDIWIKAHAAVIKMVDGEVVQVETAYGGDFTHSGSSARWYGIIQYSVQCCDTEPERCLEFKDETAWAAGDRFTQRGNWATYTPYIPDATVALYAGQHHEAGTVHLSEPVDGFVTISIELDEDWYFADISENVKIQDYSGAPSGNPAPGSFDWKFTAIGQTFIEVVPENNYYGVHIEAGQWVEVDCDE